ncbi:MAG: signal transduction histidine kinase [Polaribacter sp.]|jgi:signal transduction histidine kinase
MPNEVKRIYSKLMRIGLPADAQFKEKLKVELSNQFIFAGLACVLFQNVVNLIFLRSFMDFCLTMTWFSILFIALLFSVAKKPFLARLVIVFGGTFAVFILHILFGAGLSLEPMYILFLVVATLFFEFPLMIKSVFLIVISLSLATLISSHIQPVFEGLINTLGAFTRFIFSVAMITSLIGKLILENRRYHSVINHQNEHLKKYNQQLKNFNYIVSHDLKEPLRAIVGFSQIIKRDFDKGTEIKEKYLNHIIHSTKQLNQLVSDLKEFIDSSEKNISKEEFKIDELVNEMRLSLSELIAENNVEISCKSFPAIISSKLVLTIILRNLIENGIKYNNKEKPKIIIDGDVTNGMARIRINDNGIGIEEEYFEQIFEIFKRLSADNKKGSGLGLNITQNLITRINGEIFIVNSELNKGTTFQINFPVEMV